MKKLLILPLLVLLTGCVTYYYPESALEDGVYYAGDDPSYVFNSSDYSGVVYYPWSSLDYFYLGYWPYPGYGYVYDYPFGWGYSPWHYPYGYYGYYSARYFSHHYYSYWRPYRGYCSYPGKCNRHDRGDHHGPEDPVYRRSRVDEENDFRSNSDSSIKRYVTTPPPGYAGNQGMVIRSSNSAKIGKNRLGPTRPVTSKSVRVRSSTTGAFARPPATSSMGTRNSRSAVVSAPSRRPSFGKTGTTRHIDRD